MDQICMHRNTGNTTISCSTARQTQANANQCQLVIPAGDIRCMYIHLTPVSNSGDCTRLLKDRIQPNEALDLLDETRVETVISRRFRVDFASISRPMTEP